VAFVPVRTFRRAVVHDMDALVSDGQEHGDRTDAASRARLEAETEALEHEAARARLSSLVSALAPDSRVGLDALVRTAGDPMIWSVWSDVTGPGHAFKGPAGEIALVCAEDMRLAVPLVLIVTETCAEVRSGRWTEVDDHLLVGDTRLAPTPLRDAAEEAAIILFRLRRNGHALPQGASRFARLFVP
jgi:hypothetical protein